jgi:hypothetical protein
MLLWAFLLLVVARGVGDVVSDAEDERPSALAPAAEFPGQPERAFAVRFARAYLTWQAGGGEPGERELDALLAATLRGRFERRLPSRGDAQSVIEATVAASEPISPDRALVTVACSLAGGPSRTRYVAVPVARDADGGLIAYDLPALVAGPPAGEVEVEQATPLADPEGAEIERLVRRFISAYVAGATSEDLAFYMTPGAVVGSLTPGLKVAELSEVGELGVADGKSRSVVATVEVRDTATRAIYPARYRLELMLRERWYVESVAGEAS